MDNETLGLTGLILHSVTEFIKNENIKNNKRCNMKVFILCKVANERYALSSLKVDDSLKYADNPSEEYTKKVQELIEMFDFNIATDFAEIDKIIKEKNINIENVEPIPFASLKNIQFVINRELKGVDNAGGYGLFGG